jgi:arabinoxylan arabinofuranohydrolase
MKYDRIYDNLPKRRIKMRISAVCRLPGVCLLAASFALTAACSDKDDTGGGGGGDVKPPPEAALFENLTLATPLKPYGDHNPVMTQRFGADPWALVYDDRVYLYMTGDTVRYDNSGNVLPNEYSNINTIRLLSSYDLVNWTEHPEVRAAGASGAAKWATNSWAPAAAYKYIDGQDRFFLYFADNAGGIGVLSADTPVGPFTDPIGKALINRSTPTCSSVTWLFDPAVLEDDGDYYIYFGGGVPSGGSLAALTTRDPDPGTIRAVKLGDDLTSLDGTPITWYVPFLYEDAGINEIGDTYYFSYCANFRVEHYKNNGGDDFPDAVTIGKSGSICYMTGDDPLGPFTLQKMILPSPDEMFQQHGAGGNNHHAIFEFRGRFYIAYHSRLLEMAMGVPASVPREGYRITHIDEINVRNDGTIDVAEGTRAGVRRVGSFNPYQPTSAATFGGMAGLDTVDYMDNGVSRMKVIDIHSGDWIALYGVNFGNTGAKKFTCRVTPPPTGKGVIQIRQDSLDGKPVGYVVIEAGESGDITVDLLRKVTGTHDLVFVFYGEGYEFEEWRFSVN